MVLAQTAPTKNEIVQHFGFTQDTLITDNDTIVFYTHQKGKDKPASMVMYLQGSDASPQFSYRLQQDSVQMLCWLKDDYQEAPDNALYVVVEKVGFEGVMNEDSILIPSIYQQKNSLMHRVTRADAVINYLHARNHFQKIIVYGHSEGAPVAAKLATRNKGITHLGFWAGNALPDFYDFALEVRKQFYKGEITVEQAHEQVQEVLQGFTHGVVSDTASTEGEGHTNLRWWSYAEPPINNLLQLDIPIYVQVATEDESAPIESTYLIPLEFARLGKSNLTYKVCVGCDHGFHIHQPDSTIKSRWRTIFRDFIDWVNNN
jgi:dienelactone hydrolase